MSDEGLYQEEGSIGVCQVLVQRTSSYMATPVISSATTTGLDESVDIS